jgi:hypothetical protein
MNFRDVAVAEIDPFFVMMKSGRSPSSTSRSEEDKTWLMCRCQSCMNLLGDVDWTWLPSFLWEIIMAGILLALGYMLRRYEPNASVRGNFVFRWAFLVSFLLFIYVAGRILNYLFFRLVSLIALVPYISDVMFYVLALDGVVQHLTWVIVGVRMLIQPTVYLSRLMEGHLATLRRIRGSFTSSRAMPFCCRVFWPLRRFRMVCSRLFRA